MAHFNEKAHYMILFNAGAGRSLDNYLFSALLRARNIMEVNR